MDIDRKGCPEVFFECLPKGPCKYPYVLFFTLQPVAFIPVNYSAFLSDVVLVLWCYWEGFDDITTPEMDLYAYLVTNDCNTIAETLGLRNHHIDAVVVVGAFAFVIITPGLGFGLCTTLFVILPGPE